jgi:hypothetical protein
MPDFDRDLTTGEADTPEVDHLHECPDCGSVWTHQNRHCEVDMGGFGPDMLCPLCEA